MTASIAGGKARRRGHCWRALSTVTCGSTVTWWDKSSMFHCRLRDSLRQHTNQGKWPVHALLRVQLRPTFSCHTGQTSSLQEKRLACAASPTSWSQSECTQGRLAEGAFLCTAVSRSRAFQRVPDGKRRAWLQRCVPRLTRTRLLFYECQGNVLLNRMALSQLEHHSLSAQNVYFWECAAAESCRF